MNVAVVGSREWPYPDLVRSYVAHLPVNTTIVSGGARGVDSWAEGAARARGMKAVVFPAEWERHGLRAGFLRNRLIVDAADRIVAFHANESRGTWHTIRLAREAEKPVLRLVPDEILGTPLYLAVCVACGDGPLVVEAEVERGLCGPCISAL